MSYKLRNFSDEELISRVWDNEEIKNLVGRFAYYEAANRRDEALEELWVSEPEHEKTACYGRNWGFFCGKDAIARYYLGENRFGAVGTSLMHPFSTKLLCIAEDGVTAQGIWMGIGCETAPDSKGELDGKWINERVAIDFLKEDGLWKIWHMFVGTNYVTSAGDDYAKQPLNTEVREYRNGNPAWYMVGEGRTELEAEVALFDQIIDYPEREAFLNAKPTIVADVYTARYNDPIRFPPLPEDYRTFADVTGYDAAGFAAVNDCAEGMVQ